MAIPEDTQKKMDALDIRIQDARKVHKETNDPYDLGDEEEESPDAKKSARAGSEFLSNVFAGAFLGYGIDWYLETTPLAMILFILLGFITGVIRANAAMRKNDEENNK
ncbi:MAG: hypothetical protein COA45_02435 [Zetaproteobacteria bacterium]|nr:MAG: hypothetical protein COA45_02435 [Zetaproteobacteria bacterium]